MICKKDSLNQAQFLKENLSPTKTSCKPIRLSTNLSPTTKNYLKNSKRLITKNLEHPSNLK